MKYFPFIKERRKILLLTAKGISSFLSTRQMYSKPSMDSKNNEPHLQWDSTTRAAIVVLWGLLIYPQIDPDLSKTQQVVKIHDFVRVFSEYVSERKQCMKILQLLMRYDFIRLSHQQMFPGTKLFTSVDAAKMYCWFRTSILARKMFQQKDK